MSTSNNICSYLDLKGVPSTERIIYVACFIMLFLGIISTNSLLIHKIRSMNERTRTDLLFIVLSIFDLAVGIIALPNMCLKILSFEKILTWAMPCREFIFLLYFPTSISWVLITVIALDRCFFVLFDKNYTILITRKRLCGIVISLIVCGLATVLPVVLSNNIDTIQISASIFHISCVILISCSYLVIACYYYYKNRQVTRNVFQNRWRRSPMRIIIYVVICQLICVLPLSVMLIILVKSRLNYWALILAYCNSIFNSLIYMHSSCFKEKKKAVVKSLKKCQRHSSN